MLGPDGSFQRSSGSGDLGGQAILRAAEALRKHLLAAGKGGKGDAERAALAAQYRAEKVRCLEAGIAALKLGNT